MIEYIIIGYIILCFIALTYTVDKFTSALAHMPVRINLIDLILVGSYFIVLVFWLVGTFASYIFKQLNRISFKL